MYGVGIQGEMNSSKRNVTAAGIQHSPERNASVTSKWKTLSTEVLNKKGNAKQMPNKCHARHLNCSPPCRGMDKLWVYQGGWLDVELCTPKCMLPALHAAQLKEQGLVFWSTTEAQKCPLSYGLIWQCLEKEEGLEGGSSPSTHEPYLLTWASYVPCGPLHGLHPHA